jgi:DNA-binding response OmpR family regulator
MKRNKRVLLVEDDPTIVGLIEFRLARDGIDVVVATDGNAALAAFDSLPIPDLVLLDVLIPYRNGYELLANLRAREAWRAVPVIMLTGMAREDDIVKGLGMGATDYVTKPFRPAELSARVKALLERQA